MGRRLARIEQTIGIPPPFVKTKIGQNWVKKGHHDLALTGTVSGRCRKNGDGFESTGPNGRFRR
jgi:hypothetical protein